MKKILLLLFSPLLYFSQYTEKITIEVDNSQRIIYENTLNRLKADYYMKATADIVEEYGDRYFRELKAFSALFDDLDPQYIPYFNEQLNKLKINGYKIYDILPQLETKTISPDKMKFTVENCFKELYDFGNTKEFKTLVEYSRLSKGYSQ